MIGPKTWDALKEKYPDVLEADMKIQIHRDENGYVYLGDHKLDGMECAHLSMMFSDLAFILQTI